tara:strand:+ start:22 stop:840 length:819 start_codon:yes stop_codon:yes gene_type:complete
MPTRLQSPSSVNTFKQCKRKYFYQYIEKLPTLPNIHQVRGNIAHSCLEDFFDISIEHWTPENYAFECKTAMQRLLLNQWGKYKERLTGLDLSQDQVRFYFEETMLMLMNWVTQFVDRISVRTNRLSCSIQDAFMQLTPVREQEYKSDNYSVRGFIDAIEHLDDEIHIVDYKTNSRFDFKDSIRLQLAIYSLLYFEKHGVMPAKVGIDFLRHKKKMINVDEELLTLAKRELELVHAHTGLCEHITEYPRTITGLCKWKTGQCDFYAHCKPHGK